VSVGIDYRITNCLAVGIFGTYAHTWTSLSPGDVDVNTGRGGLYATYWNQGFYVNGGIYGGYTEHGSFLPLSIHRIPKNPGEPI
jgi:hypothetical protein